MQVQRAMTGEASFFSIPSRPNRFKGRRYWREKRLMTVDRSGPKNAWEIRKPLKVEHQLRFGTHEAGQHTARAVNAD